MILLQVIGSLLVVFLFAFAFFWPWIAEELINRRNEKKEKEAPFIYICHCVNCGYKGRISRALNGYYNKHMGKVVWKCPKCGKYIWNSVKYVPRGYVERDE